MREVVDCLFSHTDIDAFCTPFMALTYVIYGNLGA